MNKNLIALAVASAFALPLAASADTGNVVIYGNLGVSYDNVNGYTGAGAAAKEETRSRVSSNNSYLGFKGSEDLGNGLSAVWQFEQGIDMDTQTVNDIGSTSTVYTSGGTGVQSKRNTFVGIASKSMGSLTLGVQDTPLKTSTGPLDVFKDTLADYRGLFTVPAFTDPTIGTSGGSSQRAASSAMYTTPDFSGFVGKLLMAAQNETGNGGNSDPSLYSLSGTYASGPIFATAAYENTKVVSAATSDFTQKTWRVGGGYTFGDAKLGLAYEAEKFTGQVTGTAFDVKGKALYLSGAYNMGANAIKAAYVKRYNASGSVAGVGLDGANTGANQWTLGLDHTMSKRTKVYALYTVVRNDSMADYSLAGGATGIAPVNADPAGGKNARGLSLGMVHSF